MSKISKNAVIIYNLKDLKSWENKAGIDLIYSSKVLKDLSSVTELPTLLDYIQIRKIDLDMIGNLSLMWYRDPNGKSNFKENYCYGGFFQRRFRYSFGNFFRHLLVLDVLKKKYSTIYLPNNIGFEVKKAAYFHNINVELYSSVSKVDDFVLPNLDLGHIPQHKIPIRSTIANLIQTPIRLFMKNKICCIRDWSYQFEILSKTNWLYQYSYNLLRGVYFRLCNKSVILPKNLDKNRVKLNLNREISKYRFKFKNLDKLSDVIFSLIKYEWDLNIKNILLAIKSAENFINDYQPKAVFVPGMNNLESQSILEVCRRQSIPTYMIPDGLFCYYDKYDSFYKPQKLEINVSKMLLNPFLTFLLKNTKEIQRNKFTNVKSHFQFINQENYKNINDKSHCYVIICFPYGYATNPEFRWDKSFDYCLECITCLKDLGFNKIAIKIKVSTKLFNKNLIKTLQLILDVRNLNNVKILTGKFSNTLEKAKFVIGGIGSTALEALEANIPYYVYEPSYNGFSKNIINNTVFCPTDISRNTKEIKLKILKGSHLKLPNKAIKPINISSFKT